jgi:hypothetical protein
VSETRYNWEILKSAFESKDLYFLTYAADQNSFQFIPKRVFQSQEQENDFRDLIIHHLSNIQVIDRGIKGWKLSVLVGIVSLIFNYFAFSLLN